MSIALERQRWLCLLALAVTAPLPLTGVVSLPFLLPLVIMAAWGLLSRQVSRPLPGWLENLLAPAILVAVVAAGGMRFGVLRPVAHLGILLAAVRLPGVGQPRRMTSTAALIGIVGVAGIASSTHPALVAYLLLVEVLVVVAAGRLEILRFAAPGGGGGGACPWPSARLVAATVVLTALIAAPLFALFPRLRSPFAAAPFGARSVSGFREAVALHRLGDVKLSRETALLLRFHGRPGAEWVRIVGATLQHYRAGAWTQGRRHEDGSVVTPTRSVPLSAELATGPLEGAEITLVKWSENLFVPVGAMAVDLPEGLPVWQDRLQTLHIVGRVEPPVTYSVAFDPGRVVQPPPGDEDLALPPASAPLVALAETVTRGAPTPLAAALRVEGHLQTNYRYTTNTFAPLRRDPVDWFLFSRREGHCEFFASSMVLLLRAVGVPARIQAGYAGGERLDDGSFLVRESDAHAWVVAWLGDRWRVFDPTPAEGRPSFFSEGRAWYSVLSWERIEEYWDRWILTFSSADQLRIFSSLLVLIQQIRRFVLPVSVGVGGLALVILMMARRRRVTTQRRVVSRSALGNALVRVAETARQRGMIPRGELTPRQLEHAISKRVPRASSALRWLVSRHERHCYAGREAVSRGEVARATRGIQRALKESEEDAGGQRGLDAVGASVRRRRP